jgi:PIN domain nuclease of toxin-antitoxin system
MGCAGYMILLDTHIWLWLLHDPSNLSVVANRAIEAEESQSGLLVSAISVWEIAVKSSLGKLTLPLPIAQLPGEFHKDPADRILVAIARRYDISLVTCDEKILSYPHVETIW